MKRGAVEARRRNADHRGAGGQGDGTGRQEVDITRALDPDILRRARQGVAHRLGAERRGQDPVAARLPQLTGWVTPARPSRVKVKPSAGAATTRALRRMSCGGRGPGAAYRSGVSADQAAIVEGRVGAGPRPKA